MSSSGQQTDRYRIVVMGGAAVGKTCIVSRFLYQTFLSEYQATVEEFHQGGFDVNGTPVQLEILDTAGSFTFPAMRKLSIATADAIILVYSVNDASTFDELTNLRYQVLEERGDATQIPIIIVGNKTDLEPDQRAVRKAVASSTVEIEWQHGYVEVSAKEDVNITGIFKELLAQERGRFDTMPEIRRRVSDPSVRQKKLKPHNLNKANSCIIA